MSKKTIYATIRAMPEGTLFWLHFEYMKSPVRALWCRGHGDTLWNLVNCTGGLCQDVPVKLEVYEEDNFWGKSVFRAVPATPEEQEGYYAAVKLRVPVWYFDGVYEEQE